MNASSVTAVTTAPTVPVAAVLVTVLKNHDDKIILFFTTTILSYNENTPHTIFLHSLRGKRPYRATKKGVLQGRIKSLSIFKARTWGGLRANTSSC